METSLAMVRMKVLNKHGVHLSQNQRFHQVSFLGFEKTVHVADTYLDFRGVKKNCPALATAGNYIKLLRLLVSVCLTHNQNNISHP